MINTKIYIKDENDLKFNLSSDIQDDTFDFEVWYKDNCLLVYHINEDYSIDLHFGKVEKYSLSNDLLKMISLSAEQRLKDKLKDWIENSV